MSFIKNAKEAKTVIGQIVFWDEPDSPRFFGREFSGKLIDIAGKNLLINGDWKWRPNLKNLRTHSKTIDSK